MPKSKQRKRVAKKSKHYSRDPNDGTTYLSLSQRQSSSRVRRGANNLLERD